MMMATMNYWGDSGSMWEYQKGIMMSSLVTWRWWNETHILRCATFQQNWPHGPWLFICNCRSMLRCFTSLRVLSFTQSPQTRRGNPTIRADHCFKACHIKWSALSRCAIWCMLKNGLLDIHTNQHKSLYVQKHIGFCSVYDFFCDFTCHSYQTDVLRW